MPVSLQKNITIRVPAELTTKIWEEFELEIKASLTKSITRLTLDCSTLKLASSPHVGMLWLAYQECQQKGIPICLSSVPIGLMRVLKVLNLVEFFTFSSDAELALSELNHAGTPEECIQTYNSIIEAEDVSINNALIRFEEFLLEARVPEIIRFELRTVFYEVAMNIQAHSQMGDERKILFRADISGTHIIMSFSDKGIPFDPTVNANNNDPLFVAKQRKTRGIGLCLIHRLVESSEYSRGEDGSNLWILKKRWRL